jgi:hypothetical protein
MVNTRKMAQIGTVDRRVIALLDEEADQQGFSRAQLAERIICAHFGVVPPRRDYRGGRNMDEPLKPAET